MKRTTIAAGALTGFFSLACGGERIVGKSSALPDGVAPEAGLRMKAVPRGGLVDRAGQQAGPPPPAPGITAGQCGAFADGGDLRGPDCVTDTIACGETILGHTRGGVNRFDTRFYEKNFCWPATEPKDGGDERVYRLSLPEGKVMATVTLDTPCADLDLMAFRWDRGDCPTSEHRVNQCEMQRKKGRNRERINLVSQKAGDWLVVVEGNGNEEGAFAITVQCGGWN